MKLPIVVRICGYDYSVTIDSKAVRDKGALGLSCGNNLSIVIDSTIPEQNQSSTLLHEIIEQINFRFQLELEHRTITTLESTLYQVLKENKLHFDE